MPIYSEIWAGPGRNVKRINGVPINRSKWYVTIHNTSNDASARGEIAYAKVRTDGTGSHYYADDIEVLQSTDTDLCVGHVGSTEGNERGLSYEITGVNSWTREQWLSNVAWGKLAAVIARDCKHFGIPVRLLTIAQMRQFSSGVKGFVTHDMARIAWGDTTHTDPGPNFPMDHLLALVGAQLNGDDDMFEERDRATLIADTWRMIALLEGREVAEYKLPGEQAPRREVNGLKAQLDRLEAKVAALSAPTLSDEQLARFADLVAARMATPEQIAVAVADEDHKRSAE